MYIFFIWLALVNSITSNKIKCSNCKHFILPYIKDQYVLHDIYGTCGKFTYIDTVTYEIQSNLALHSRLNEEKCGKNGKYYEPAIGKDNDYRPTI